MNCWRDPFNFSMPREGRATITARTLYSKAISRSGEEDGESRGALRNRMPGYRQSGRILCVAVRMERDRLVVRMEPNALADVTSEHLRQRSFCFPPTAGSEL